VRKLTTVDFGNMFWFNLDDLWFTAVIYQMLPVSKVLLKGFRINFHIQMTMAIIYLFIKDLYRLHWILASKLSYRQTTLDPHC
jgi:hypothetical protein